MLFVDLVGFTTVAERLDAETIREQLDAYYERVRRVVERYGGTVEKFIGDAVMAVWGTPLANEDDAERSVRAALDLVADRSLFTGSGAGPDIQLRAGIATGEAATTPNRSAQAIVAGDLVNTASRLQASAPPGGVLVDEATHGSSSAAVAFEAAGPLALRGREAPVHAYRALRVVAERGGRGRASQPEPPFVGRSVELRLIRDLFHATAAERRTRLVSVVGQAGIGKSRLAWEFLKYLDGLDQTVYWHDGRSPAYGDGIAFWALGEMVRTRAGLAEGDDADTTRRRIGEMLATFVPDSVDRAWIEPRLLQLLGVDSETASDAQELFAAWRTFFERVAAQAPAVLVFEDLHWADAGLLDFIEHLLTWARGHPIFILTLARPELLDRRPDWGAGQRNFTSLTLDPLTPAATRELLEGFVPGLPDEVARQIVDRAEGVPLYAVELVRTLLHDGRLEAIADHYRWTGGEVRLELPDSLRGLVAARLDRLDVKERTLLQTAAVLGQTFVTSALAAITGEPDAALVPRLALLVRRDILVLDTDPRSPERGQFGFVQAVVREVAYSTLSRRERRSRHLAAARYLESVGDDEMAGALASHYQSAFDASPEGPEAEAVAIQARLALRAAAERATALGSHDQALGYLQQALAILPGQLTSADRALLLERAALAALDSGRHAPALDLATEALELYSAAGDEEGIARASVTAARTQVEHGYMERAREILEPIVGRHTELRSAAQVAVVAQLARAEMMVGGPRALALADRALEAAERLDLLPLIPEVMTTKAAGMLHAGRIREAVVLARGALDLARQHGSVVAQLRAANNLAGTGLFEDPVMAYREARAGYELARRLGLRDWAAGLGDPAMSGAVITGDWDWAIATGRELAEWDLTGGSRVGVLQTMAWPLFYRVRIEEAVHALDLAEEPLATIDRPYYHAAQIWFRGEIELLSGRLDAAFDSEMEAAAIDGGLGVLAAIGAARAASWLGDAQRFRVALGAVTAHVARGRWLAAQRTALGARLAAFEDRRADAIRGYASADRQWQDLGLDWDRALTLLDMVVAVGPGPDTGGAAANAREIFDRLGAAPMLARLDAMMATDQAGSANPSLTTPTMQPSQLAAGTAG